ncbi:hypothetical protein [uncultured Jannaschia sp.]|uniref:hypothetical protein n=1 Tax=uncultured Jannaschia sp. TaxID=293347 RepID=UPI002609A0BE|nr:hypothetical protein [uncultured Jannaschia sp.]
MTQTSEPAVFTLSATLNHDTVRELAEFLAVRRGVPVTIDGTASGRVGAQAAQTLAVAVRCRAEDAVPLKIVDPSGIVARSLETLGLAETFADALIHEGAAA